MITGVASDGVYDLLFQYLKLKLGFTTKDLVRQAALHASLSAQNEKPVPPPAFRCHCCVPVLPRQGLLNVFWTESPELQLLQLPLTVSHHACASG
jgi:hypothetical protein